MAICLQIFEVFEREKIRGEKMKLTYESFFKKNVGGAFDIIPGIVIVWGMGFYYPGIYFDWLWFRIGLRWGNE